jgi:hypothetical protein
MVTIAIATYSAFGAPAMLMVEGHPVVRSIVVSRDLGDSASHSPTLRGVPCVLIDFATAHAADDALARLGVISAKFTHKESPTRLACSGEVRYTLRVVRSFDEDAIATVAEYYDLADARYMAAQQNLR